MQVVKKYHSRRNRWLVGVALLLTLLGAGVALAAVTNVGPFSDQPDASETTDVDYNDPTEEQTDAGADIKEQTTKSEGKPTTGSSGEGAADTPTSGTVGVEITNEPRETDGKLSVKTLVQEVSSSGTCTLALSKSGQSSLTKTAGVQPLASASACKFNPFNVSSLTSGTWTLTVTYKSNNSYGSATQKVQL